MDELDSLTVTALRAKAVELGVSGVKALRKAELLAAIRSNQRTQIMVEQQRAARQRIIESIVIAALSAVAAAGLTYFFGVPAKVSNLDARLSTLEKSEVSPPAIANFMNNTLDKLNSLDVTIAELSKSEGRIGGIVDVHSVKLSEMQSELRSIDTNHDNDHASLSAQAQAANNMSAKISELERKMDQLCDRTARTDEKVAELKHNQQQYLTVSERLAKIEERTRPGQ